MTREPVVAAAVAAAVVYYWPHVRHLFDAPLARRHAVRQLAELTGLPARDLRRMMRDEPTRLVVAFAERKANR